MKKSLVIIVVVLLVFIGIVIVYFMRETTRLPSGQITPFPTQKKVISRDEYQKEPEVNITVSSPRANDTVSLPIRITGTARVFENQLNYRIRDADGTILTEGSTYANSPDTGMYGPFIINVSAMDAPQGTRGTIEVFDYSAKDGSQIDTVSVPIQFAQEKNLSIRIYFGNNQQSGEFVCENVVPILRSIQKTSTPARSAMEQLLKGPTESEKLQGYFTSINTNVKVQKLTITNGVARVDFDKRLEEGVGGSCRVAAIRAQITQTLKQFASVHEVIISIDGRTEDILQP